MLTGVPQVGMERFLSLLSHTMRTGGNLLALGMAGTGKTESAKSVALELGFETVYLNLSVLEAPDLLGLPMIGPDQTVVYAAPRCVPRSGKKKIFLIDEVDKAKPELTAPLLELIQFHTINGEDVAMQAAILTGNLPDEGAHSQLISTALTNRCLVYKLNHEFEPWRQWALTVNLNPLVVGFLIKNPQLLSVPSNPDDPTAYCRPSPRSWAAAAKEIDNARNENSDMLTDLVAGRVGDDAAIKFKVWLDHYRVVEPIVEAIVAGKPTKFDNLSIDKVFVLAISLAGQVRRADPKKAKEVAARVFKAMADFPPEIQIGAVKASLDIAIIQKLGLASVPEVMVVYQKVAKALG